MLTALAELETAYMKKDKPLPKDLSEKINRTLMLRLTKALRFKHFIKNVNTRFSDPFNPVCPDLQYTPYEQALYNLCNQFNIEVTYKVKDLTEERKKCLLDISFDIQQKNLSCELLSGLSITQVIQKKCDPSVTVSISETNCKKYYNELIQQKSCNYSYDQYKNLLSLGFLPKVIDFSVQNGAYISPDGKYLTTTTSSYNLETDLCFRNITTNGIGDVDEFLSSVITDLPNSLKEEILDSYDK